MPGLLELVEKTENGYKRKTVKIDNYMLNMIRSLVMEWAGDKYLANKLDEIKNNSQEPYEIPSDLFADFIEKIKMYNDIHLTRGEAKVNELSEYSEKYNKAIQAYRTFIESFMDAFLISELFSDTQKLREFIELSQELKQTRKEMHGLRDYKAAKEDIRKNLSYFETEERIKGFEDRYDVALSMRNIDEMKSILNEVQQLILNHWKEYVTNIDDFKPGDKFRFICHSTDAFDFNGEFYTRYVSTSLLTDELHDTFRGGNNGGYGFVFLPENIIGANSNDMYINNSAESEDELIRYSTVVKLDAPERLIDECKSLKEKNTDGSIDRTVYNEVVIDGFNPVGIFCLTDGSKNLDWNYKYAAKLKEKFPNLKFVEIDTTYYKDDNLLETKRKLMENILLELSKTDPYYAKADYREQMAYHNVTDEMIPRYDYFWNKFMELKQKGNYSEDDIIKLFVRTKQLVQGLIIDDLNTYNDEELKCLLENNYHLGIHKLLNGRISLLSLNSIYTGLSKVEDKERLDRIMPGLSTFLELYRQVDLTKDNINEFMGYRTFDELNQGMRNIIESNKKAMEEKQPDLLSQENDTASRIREAAEEAAAIRRETEEKLAAIAKKRNELEGQRNSYKAQISEYEDELREKQGQMAKYNESQRIVDFEIYYHLATTTIDVDENFKRQDKQSLAYYSEEESRLLKKLSDMSIELFKLRKHKILRARAIRNKEKQKLEVEDCLQTALERKEECIESIYELDGKINDAKYQFERKSGIKYQEFMKKLEDARKEVEKTDSIGLLFDISDITRKIEELRTKLDEVEIRLDGIQDTNTLTEGYASDGFQR